MAIAEPRTRTHTDLAARFVIRAAATAPSIHNTRPWRFAASGDTVRLYTDEDRLLPFSDPPRRPSATSSPNTSPEHR